jgi:hypothetical protein
MIPFWRPRFWTSHFGELVGAVKAALPIAVLWSFVQQMVAKTAAGLAPDPFLLGLSILMVIFDTGTGCYKVIKNQESVWSTKAFGGMVDKIIKYAILILVFNSIAAAGARADLPTAAFAWIGDFGYLVVIVREGGSAIENVWGRPLGELMAQFGDTVDTASK